MSRGFEDDEILGKAYDGRLVRRMAVFVAPYWRRLAVAVVLLVGAALTELAPPLLVQRAIDGPISSRQLDGMWPIFTIYALVLGSNFALRYSHNYIINSVGQQVMQDMRTAIFRHIQRMSLSFFDRNPVGRLLTRITNDVDSLNEFLTQGLVLILADMVTLVGIISVMLVLNWRLALISMATLPVLTIIVSIYQRHMRASYRVVRQRLAKINAYLNEQIGGVLVTQLFNREARSQAHFADLSEQYLRANVRSVLIFALFIPAVSLMAAVGTAAVLYGGGQGVLAGWATIGTLVAFVQYTERAFQPILRLSEQYNSVQIGLGAAERIQRTLQARPAIGEPARPATIGHIRGAVEFRDVRFSYLPDEPVLRGVSLRIPAGQNVAVVGATGAGKSSLVGLLARFYDPQGGAVLLDGVDIRDLSLADLRRAVAVVPQDPVCLAGTIAQNIRLYRDDISDEAMREAARQANADGFIAELPGGYDYEVLPGGANLSVGQRQLLALARALCLSPEGVLVLDEATSSIDTATETLIQQALERILRTRTSIVIAHRLSTVRRADRIIVMARGQIIEDGSHDELLAQDGAYARLSRHQLATRPE